MKVRIKKWDIIIIGLLLILSFLPYGFIKLLLGNHIDQVYATITVEQKFYKEIPLTGQVGRKEFVIETAKGSNKVVVENESIAIIEADCSDHVCEQFGFRNTPGDVIVCLPHQILIKIEGTKAKTNEETQLDAIGY